MIRSLLQFINQFNMIFIHSFKDSNNNKYLSFVSLRLIIFSVKCILFGLTTNILDLVVISYYCYFVMDFVID